MSILEITVLAGSDTGRRYRLERLPVVVGRSPEADVRLADDPWRPTLSRRHLELTIQDGIVMGRDLGRNGTVLNHCRMPAGSFVALPERCCLRLGPVHVVQVEHSASAPSGGVDPLQPIPPTYANLCAPQVLHAAWRRVALNRGSHGIDSITIEEFAENSQRELRALRQLLRSRRYEPLPARIVTVPKRSGGVRRLSVFTVRDRVVQQALATILQPFFEPSFRPVSFAYRNGVSAHDGLRAVDKFIESGLTWVVDADIQTFFDTVSHARLLPMLDDALADDELGSLVRQLLASGQCGLGVGLAQGAATSPLYSNVYLTPFDLFLEGRGRGLVRYADDLVILCRERSEAETALLECERFLREGLALGLRPDKTRVVELGAGFTFLGFRFDSRGRRPAPEAVSRLEERLQELPSRDSSRGRQILTGWNNYFGLASVPGGEDLARGPHGLTASSSPVSIEQSEHRGDDSDAQRMLPLFQGRQDRYAVQWSRPGRRTGYLPRSEALSEEALERHLRGEETLGIYLLLAGGKVRHLVLDVDSPRAEEPGLEAHRLAWDLAAEGRRFAIPTWVEETGGKGLHVWVVFSEPVAAAQARQLGRHLAARVGIPRRGVTLEIFPREDRTSGLGSLIKLPWGVHLATGRRSRFLREDGAPFELHEFLRRVRLCSGDQLQKALQRLASMAEPSEPSRAKTDPTTEPRTPLGHPDPIERILKGCPLLRELVDRPLETGHLVHSERLILLHTFGHLGEAGARFIHRVIARCDNYDPRVTQRWIDRLDTGRSPLGCSRLKEWLGELVGQVQCRCSDVRGPYRSPAFLGLKPPDSPRKCPRSRPQTRPAGDGSPGEEDDWRSVHLDLFSTDKEEEDRCPPCT
ncbi:MAG: FHA domain-containing protein [Armatimonadetes bacterium]|nr:FHA domain-containing protein [Armatimonadota bacterium]